MCDFFDPDVELAEVIAAPCWAFTHFITGGRFGKPFPSPEEVEEEEPTIYPMPPVPEPTPAPPPPIIEQPPEDPEHPSRWLERDGFPTTFYVCVNKGCNNVALGLRNSKCERHHREIKEAANKLLSESLLFRNHLQQQRDLRQEQYRQMQQDQRASALGGIGGLGSCFHGAFGDFF